MTLFKLDDFKASSGAVLPFKIDCDALTPDDWDCLAAITSGKVRPFGLVEGVPRGGLPFQAALEKYKTEGQLLIVDDVYTTGGSMEEYRAGRWCQGVVVFARNRISEDWIIPIFTMSN